MQLVTRFARQCALVLGALLAITTAVQAADTAGAGSGLTGVVNVNTATLEELQLLPGIGEARARAVITARKQRGGFKSVDDLVEVKGIGATALERMRPHVSTQGKTTARTR